MGLKNTFCSSPWFHMRIDPQGNFRPCRWGRGHDYVVGNIQDTSLEEYFQNTLAPLRQEFLRGDIPNLCSDCHHMEQHGKVSGRQRQLLKSGINLINFDKTLASSTMLENFQYSDNNQGRTDLVPQDWQIDLGNYCNSACVFCSPEYSSKLAVEYKRLGLINTLPRSSWADDPALVEKFCDFLSQTSRLSYLHFLGGETLITPSFKIILKKLLAAGHKDTHIGFTTNLTVWPQEVIDLLAKFSNLHVGLSIECLHPLNDYIRWPSDINKVKIVLDRWVAFSKSHGWMIQLRPTPNCFTVMYIDTVYRYAYENNIGIETCNFIENPREFRINALPPDLMDQAKQKLKDFLDQYRENNTAEKIINTRNKTTLSQQVWQDAKSYFTYLENESHEPDLPFALVSFLKLFENSRNNRIIDYIPEYEKFLTDAGY